MTASLEPLERRPFGQWQINVLKDFGLVSAGHVGGSATNNSITEIPARVDKRPRALARVSPAFADVKEILPSCARVYYIGM